MFKNPHYFSCLPFYTPKLSIIIFDRNLTHPRLGFVHEVQFKLVRQLSECSCNFLIGYWNAENVGYFSMDTSPPVLFIVLQR